VRVSIEDVVNLICSFIGFGEIIVRSNSGKGAIERPNFCANWQCREALKRVAAGEPLREIALSYAVDHGTISRLARHAAEL
jgi:hypothetical protein